MGEINGQIQLNFSSGVVGVPVIGTVKPIIQSTPATIQLASDSFKKVKRLVMLRSGAGGPFEILSTELGNADRSGESRKLSDSKWQGNFSVRPDSIEPNAPLSVRTSCPIQWVVEIPVIRE